MTHERKVLLLLAAWVAGAVVLDLMFGAWLFDVGGEGLVILTGLALFGLMAMIGERIT